MMLIYRLAKNLNFSIAFLVSLAWFFSLANASAQEEQEMDTLVILSTVKKVDSLMYTGLDSDTGWNSITKTSLKILKKSNELKFLKGEYLANNLLGRIYEKLGKIDSAIYYKTKNISCAAELKNNPNALGKAYYNLGNTYLLEDSYDSAIRNFNEALSQFQKTNFTLGQLLIFVNLADIYENVGLSDKSIQFLKKALRLVQENTNETRELNITINLADVFFKKKELDSSLYYLGLSKEVLKICKQKSADYSEVQKVNLAELQYNINLVQAQIALANGKVTEAINYLDKACTFVKHNPFKILEAEGYYGEAYLIKGEYDKAEAYFLSALGEERSASLKEDRLSIYQGLLKVYSKTKNIEGLSQYIFKYNNLNDSLNNAKKTQLIAYYSDNIDNSIKDKTILDQKLLINEQESELFKRKTFYTYAVLAILVIGLLGFLFVQYKNQKYKNKVNLELKENNKQLTVTQTQLSDALTVEKQFLNTISHELRTPLNAIINSVQILENKQTDVEEYKEVLNSSSNYLLNYIENILVLNKLGKDGIDKESLEEHEFNLREIFRYLFGLKLSDFNQNNLILDIAEDVPEKIVGDASKFSQLLFNLIDIVAKCAPYELLKLNVSKNELSANNITLNFKLVVNHLTDTIDENLKQILADLTINPAANTSFEKGKNIKVEIVKNRLRLMQSSLKVAHENNSTVVMAFNIAFRTDLNKELTKTSGPKKNKVKILIVEDNEVNQMIARVILSDAGFVCDIANDGVEGVEKATTVDYDLILMDIMMPRLNGFEASKEILARNKDARIIALTALDYRSNREDFESAGIKYVLNKPVNSEKLISKINELLGV